MKKSILCLPALILALFAPLAGQTEPAQHKLVQFQMAIMKKGPKWTTMKPEERNAIMRQHVGSVVSLLSSGKMAISGPFGDDTDLAGIFIFRTADAAEAKSLVDDDAAVKAGVMTAEMHPWFSEDVFKKANLPIKMSTVYFAF